MLKIIIEKHRAQNIEKHHAQSIDIMLKCRNMLKGRNIHTCSIAETFICVAIQNVTTWLSYTELRIIAGQQTISDPLCCMSEHFSETCNDILT